MKTKILLLICTTLLISCKKTEPTEPIIATDTISVKPIPPKPNTEIISGSRIGNIAIGMNAEKIQGILGVPDLSDSAMGKSWMTWYSTNSKAVSGKYEINVFTNYKDVEMNEKTVQLIRATSPEFDVDSVSPDSSFEAVSAKFPNVKYVGAYHFEKTKDFVELYDEKAQGIAFEFLKTDAGNNCISIIVHEKDQDVIQYYKTFRPDIVVK